MGESPLFSFLLETCKIKPESATIIHGNLVQEEVIELQHLIDFLTEDEEQFKDLLKEVGCKRVHIRSIKAGLKAYEASKKAEAELSAEKEKREREKKPFVLVITGGKDLNTSEETEVICNALAGDKRKALLLDENYVASLAESLSENRDIECVHFALRGPNSAFSGGQHPLAMKTSKDNDDWRIPKEVGDVIDKSQANVQLIVLNVCQGAKSAGDFIGGGADYTIG